MDKKQKKIKPPKKEVSAAPALLKPMKALTRRFNLTLFFILVAAGLSGAVMVINNTLKEKATDPNYISEITAGSIDQVTLNRLNALHTSAQGTVAPTLPSGRVNPVNE
jgi:hypothetical protein